MNTVKAFTHWSLLGLLISSTMLFNAEAHTEKFVLYSEDINQEFTISVTVPESYSPDKSYPLIVFTDANQNYISNLVTETNIEGLRTLTERLLASGDIPELVLVGIGYPTRNYRVRDLTPVQIPNQPKNMSGGANKFATFIETEVKPFIYSKVQIDHANETYVGHSHGGLFGAYVLFNKPELFDNYVLSSPSFWYGRSVDGNYEGVSFTFEEQYRREHEDMPKSVYISVGSEEGGTMAWDAKRMYQILDSRNYRSLNLEWMLFEGESHMSVVKPAYSDGLSFIFKNR